MNAGETKMWQRARGWWEVPQLMQMREAWIDKQIEMVEDIVTTLPNGYTSRPEWRATIAEATATRYYRVCHLPRGSLACLALNQMRNTWAEEAMMFFTIGQPIETTFDLTAHGQAMERHHEERLDWRPHHRLPGPPDRLYAHPVPAEGLTKDWWQHRHLQDLRRKVVLGNLSQNDTVARVLSDDPSYSVDQARDWLACKQGFGYHFQRRDDRIVMSEEQDHFERGVFAMMRGFVGEVQAFTKYGLPITQDFDPSNLWTICEAKGQPWHSPYLLKGTSCW